MPDSNERDVVIACLLGERWFDMAAHRPIDEVRRGNTVESPAYPTLDLSSIVGAQVT